MAYKWQYRQPGAVVNSIFAIRALTEFDCHWPVRFMLWQGNQHYVVIYADLSFINDGTVYFHIHRLWLIAAVFKTVAAMGKPDVYL
jgi:hypothetical protein